MIDGIALKLEHLEPMTEAQHQNLADRLTLFTQLERSTEQMEARIEAFSAEMQSNVERLKQQVNITIYSSSQNLT